MKKLTYFLGLGILASSMFISCSTDETALAPSLNVTSDNPVVAAPNSVITIAWRADAGDAKLATFTIKEGNVAILDEDNIDWNNADIDNSQNTSYVDEARVKLGTTDTQFKLTVTDKDGKSGEVAVVVTIDNSQPGGEINTYSARLMGAQKNLDVGSYLDAFTGDVMKDEVAIPNSEKVDIVYYFGSKNEGTLTAPDDVTVNGGAGNLDLCSNFTVKNATRFEVTNMTPAEFDAILDDAAFMESVSESKIILLSVGDVIAFETHAKKKGLIHISALTEGENQSITIDVKIQK